MTRSVGGWLRGLAALGLGLGALTAGAEPAAAEGKSPWAALAEADVEALHQALQENHPGAVDRQNPAFGKWLEEGHRQALARAREATTFGGYQHALKLYTNGFHDGHLRVGFGVQPARLRTPGWTVALRDGHFVVRVQEGRTPGPSVPAVGSELLSCDGRAPARMLEEDVLPYDGTPTLEASRTRMTPLLLVDAGNPWRTLPRACRVREGGKEREVALAWDEVDTAKVDAFVKQAAFGQAPDFGVRPVGKGGVWVSMPSFGVGGESGAQLKRLVAQAAGWRGKSLVVLDVRGNTGGSSQWGADLLRNLYGTEPQEPAAERATYVEWRASQGNARYVESLIGILSEQFGADTDVVKWVRGVSSGLAQAAARGEALWRQPADGDAKKDAPKAARKVQPLKGKVFVVTDGRCASACLDFLDRALAYPGVVHVGLPTSADTPYMEVRVMPLPSGTASLMTAIKVYRNRTRDNEPYVPVHRFSGEMGDTAALEKWVLGLAKTPVASSHQGG